MGRLATPLYGYREPLANFRDMHSDSLHKALSEPIIGMLLSILMIAIGWVANVVAWTVPMIHGLVNTTVALSGMGLMTFGGYEIVLNIIAEFREAKGKSGNHR